MPSRNLSSALCLDRRKTRNFPAPASPKAGASHLMRCNSMIPKKPAPAKAGVDTGFRKEIMLNQ